MEGGYDEDPYDPGGPTNRGITLSEFVRDKGLELTSENFAALKAELKAITPDTVRRIYHHNYWNAACCPELPPPLALFHFDVAVNQGVVGAARMLQQAVAAEIDGEIGPLTLAAVAGHPVEETLAAYADVRRRRYRALPTFWRFGKGWLSRVDATLALANDISRQMPPLVPPQPEQPKGSRPMPTDTDPAIPSPSTPDAKWWGHSDDHLGRGRHGPVDRSARPGARSRHQYNGRLIRQLGDNVVLFGQAAGGLIGTIMAIYGRVRTSTPIERRQFTISM